MEQFLGFAIPGIPYGCTYAMVAVCLVLTYQATGVFNFAFGARPSLSAFVFTVPDPERPLAGFAAFLLSVVVLAPLIGLAFDRLLFRNIPNSNTTAKLVIGHRLLGRASRSLLPVIFGAQNLDDTATIFPFFNPNIVYFTAVLRHPDQRHLPGHDHQCGRRAGPADDSAALHEPGPADAGRGGEPTPGPTRRRQRRWRGGRWPGSSRASWRAWPVSSWPPSTARFNSIYATLTVTAIAAAAWALLRSMPIAAGVAVLIGVVDHRAAGVPPAEQLLVSAVVPSLPFFVLVAALLILPGMRTLDASRDPAGHDRPTHRRPIAAATAGAQHGPDHPDRSGGLLAAFIVSMLTWIPTPGRRCSTPARASRSSSSPSP